MFFRKSIAAACKTYLLCRPLRNHSATWPQEREFLQADRHLSNLADAAARKILKLKTAVILKLTCIVCSLNPRSDAGVA